MGCENSTSERKNERVFGSTGLHVGRHGDVDLTSRSMDIFGPKFVELIKRDKLHNARRLHLSDNKLYTLGKEMTLLPDIEELYINGNRFERLPEVLSHMPSLELLNASNNPLGHQNYALAVLPRIAVLQQAILRDCSLGALPSCVLDCAMLKTLDLSNNLHLQLGGVQFSKLQNLQTLILANCGLMGSLPTGIKNITTLESLDISSNFWKFDDSDFFGKHLPSTLTELHLRSLQLTAVPQVVVSLRKLSSLDLAQNPIETLDVLAGRLVRRLTPRAAAYASPVTAQEPNDDATSVSSQMTASTRVSISQLSRAGMIAHVAQPIPLRKLSLRGCDLRNVPKYFHKLTNLTDIDLSENEHLDDPNLTLFSFQNLQVLNIIGCPFATNPGSSRNEWFDIAKLRNLHTLNWEVWRGVRNMNPYRTKIPVEICGLPLREVNDLTLRPGLFVQETVQTIVNLLLDGYYKVDFAISDNFVYGYAAAVHALNPLEHFFFTDDEKATSGKPKRKLCCEALQIAVNRYIFFLTMQAANYSAVIIPPADVMAIHYAQMTQSPILYRTDCEAICGQVLSCNYRLFFLEQKNRPHAVKEAMVGSKRVWNMMVRTAQRDLRWLRYDFWEKRAKNGRSLNSPTLKFSKDEIGDGLTPNGLGSATNHGTVKNSSITPQSLLGGVGGVSGANYIPPMAISCAPAAPPPSTVENTMDLKEIDSMKDLRSVLDQSITTYFIEQGLGGFHRSLERFFNANKVFLKHETALRSLNLDWTRYVKYMALFAYVHHSRRSNGKASFSQRDDLSEPFGTRQNNSFVSPDAYLPRPPSNSEPMVPRRNVSTLPRVSSNHNDLSLSPQRRTTSLLSRNADSNRRRLLNEALAAASGVDPVPTVGLTLLLHCHRIAHAKYYQVLVLLGIENVDVTWEESTKNVEATMKLWEALYNERYIDLHNAAISFDGPGLLAPISTLRRDSSIILEKSSNLRSALRRGNHKRMRSAQVTLCTADTDQGMF